ncbi:MAG: stage III sporulation protein AF [Clostridia bacterium]|nr:stage III sporulation protein AF [Clostridia bacterium]MDE7215177.1 stage III sporulation protein AF [Clostridia bacterium]
MISIVGIVSLGVLIEIVLPEGENTKYIRGIFSIIVIFVIVSPLPKMLKGDFFKDFVIEDGAQIEIDEEYYQSVKESIHKSVIEGLKDKLSANGYENITFEVTFAEDYAYSIKKVVVKNSFSSEDEWNKVKRIIMEYVGRATVEKENS